MYPKNPKKKNTHTHTQRDTVCNLFLVQAVLSLDKAKQKDHAENGFLA
jgi:hypothetical protein